MTSRSVYLGDSKGEGFEYDGGEWGGNFPRHLGPSWPVYRRDEGITQWGVYSEIVARAMSDQYEGKMTDWGCWVTWMTRDELLEFIDECYGDGPVYPPEWTIRGKNKEDYEIRRFVRSLSPTEKYLLVALET